jgi:hypothetical protein
VEAIVELMMTFGKLAVLLVAPQQEVLYLLCFSCAHGRTLLFLKKETRL